MYIVQSCAVDVDDKTWRNIGEELTASDLKKIGSKRLKAMLTTMRVIEIEVVNLEPKITIEPVKEKPKHVPKKKQED